MNTEWDNDSFRSRPRLNRAAVWTGSGRPQRPAGATSFILLNEILWRMMVHEQSVINVAFMPTVIDRPYKLKFISCYSPGLRIWHTKRRIWSNTNSLIQASPRLVRCTVWYEIMFGKQSRLWAIQLITIHLRARGEIEFLNDFLDVSMLFKHVW